VPFTSILYINGANDYSQIEILDLAGQSVKSIQINKTLTQINLSDLKQGIYIIHFSNESTFITKKIIKN
jgi:hypothetical protein